MHDESLRRLRRDGGGLDALPFGPGDVTAGTESELQAVVVGARHSADLPITLERSRYLDNVRRRAGRGARKHGTLGSLERYLAGHPEGIWENSWVRFPRRLLGPWVELVLDHDLKADKSNPSAGYREDRERFEVREDGEDKVRVPISYLLKLSLADAIYGGNDSTPEIVSTGERLLSCFLNDNTSPETVSLRVVHASPEAGNGRVVVEETLRRYLLTQLLVAHANRRFELESTGQKCVIFSSPHPPVRQRLLNSCISDSFYREMFMSPCLSGWDRGEEKSRYMALCHEVLSRSHLNGVASLREAGIITRNLVVLPSTSNISLANNGTHLSLGSRRLSSMLAGQQDAGGFGEAHEKCLGDLSIKLLEHFLPLLVGHYSAAPYRLGFSDLHPERALGFLPHELDPPHLREVWRRWKAKSSNRILGRPLCPKGPVRLDRTMSRLLRLKGDFVPDYRLIDYPIALLSTRRSPALDGTLGNQDRLKADLQDLGIFDRRMSIYLPIRLREHRKMGFSGLESRGFSLFESLQGDMGPAVDLHLLLAALVWRWIAEGRWTHRDVPDDPFTESERRQIMFAAAIDLPDVCVRRRGPNRFLHRILRAARRTPGSRRLRGHVRVSITEYRRALLDLIERDGRELIAELGMERTIEDLRDRIDAPDERSASARLTRGILAEAGTASALDLDAESFNAAAETYYRERLRRRHMAEALEALATDARRLDRAASLEGKTRRALRSVLGPSTAQGFLARVRNDLLAESADPDDVCALIHLLLLLEWRDSSGKKEAERW